MPSKPGAGLVRNVNRCPADASKSFGMSQAANASADVRAAHTRSTGCAYTTVTSISAFIVALQVVPERGEARPPEPFELVEPVTQVSQPGRPEFVVTVPPLPSRRDEPGFPQYPQML